MCILLAYLACHCWLAQQCYLAWKNDTMSDARKQRLTDFVAWVHDHMTGDEKGQAQIFLDRLFQAFGQKGCLEVGGTPEFRIRKAKEDGGGTAFADYVWKPVVLIEMKKRGADFETSSLLDRLLYGGILIGLRMLLAKFTFDLTSRCICHQN